MAERKLRSEDFAVSVATVGDTVLGKALHADPTSVALAIQFAEGKKVSQLAADLGIAFATASRRVQAGLTLLGINGFELDRKALAYSRAASNLLSQRMKLVASLEDTGRPIDGNDRRIAEEYLRHTESVRPSTARACNVDESVVRTVVRKLSSFTNKGGHDLPLESFRRVKFKSILEEKEESPKTAIEGMVLRHLHEGGTLTGIAEQCNTARSMLSAFVRMTRRELADCETTATQFQELEQVVSEIKEFREKASELNKKLFPLYLQFREAHRLSFREKAFLEMRLTNSVTQVATALGISMVEGSVWELAFLGKLSGKDERQKTLVEPTEMRLPDWSVDQLKEFERLKASGNWPNRLDPFLQ